MRALLPCCALAFASLSLAPAALAYNGPTPPPDPPAENGPRTIGFEVALDGGGYFGSHGGDVTDACGSTAQCHDRKGLTGTRFGGRAGVTLLEPRVGFDLDLGFWSGSSRTGRNMTMFGEQALAVPVDFTDTVDWSGISFGAAVRYDFTTKPVVFSGSLGFGYLAMSVDVGRTGTITTDAGAIETPPRTSQPIPTVNTSAFYMAPELRVAVPLPANIRVGVAIGALLTSNFEVRPEKLYSAVSCGNAACTYNGKPIGFVPQPNAKVENEMDHLYLLRGSLFASIAF